MDFEAYTRDEFCKAYKIGHSKYYLLKAEGLAPRETHIGRKIIISKEAAKNWLRMMDERTASKILEAV